MGPHGINRAVHRISFSDCQNGLGNQIAHSVDAELTRPKSTLSAFPVHTDICTSLIYPNFMDLTINPFSTVVGITISCLFLLFVVQELKLLEVTGHKPQKIMGFS